MSEEPLKPSESEACRQTSIPAEAAGTGKKTQRGTRLSAAGVLASGIASGTRMAGALDHAAALLERVVATAPPPALHLLLRWLERGYALSLQLCLTLVNKVPVV